MLLGIEGRRIELARPEKWVWYDAGLTILDLVKYYVAVAPWLLPHLHRRPVVYEIYPGTIHGPNSFEQDPPTTTPRWIKRVRIAGHERVVTYVIVEDAATLVYLVSLFMVTVHVWESTTRAIERPDWLLFDLDPLGECTLARLARAALRCADELRRLGLQEALVKTSGARGLHVVVPLTARHDYKVVRAFTQRVARRLEQRFPNEFTAARTPSARPADAIYIDWGQMGRGMTVAAPYAARACDGAPVSMPVSWETVARWSTSRSKRAAAHEFERFDVRSVPALLREHGDVWAAARPQSLAGAISLLDAS